jgi:hypothetical protein
MIQMNLFDDQPQLARQSDPVTSQAAAEEVRPKIGQLQQAFLAALAAIGKPATAREIGERAKDLGLAKEPESVRKRAAELEEKRLISVVEVRRCEYTNKLAETWKLI